MGKLFRTVHLYLALFLAPWVLMYLLSTMAMNHRPTMSKWFGETGPDYEIEQTLTYDRVFSESVKPGQAADQILEDLELSGTRWVQGSVTDSPLVILRESPLMLRRITFSAQTRTLTIEKARPKPPSVLEEMHRRAGFSHGFLLNHLWAISVDLVIAAIVLWAVSGLWIWWGFKKTRTWGAICLISGIGLFSFFLLMI